MPRPQLICAFAVILFVGSLRAYTDPKRHDVDPKKLVGVCELETGPVDRVNGATLEFMSDGRVKHRIGPLEVDGGTYAVTGTVITIQVPPGQGEGATGLIKELTDSRLVIHEEQKPKAFVFKRVMKKE